MEKSKPLKWMVLSAMMTALITVVTMMIKIPSATGGYLNLGDFVIMISVAILPFPYALFAAGVGSALADLAAGYAFYAPFTLLIKAGEVVILYLLRNTLETSKRWIAFGLAGLWMMVMYGFLAAWIAQSWGAMLIAFKGDVFQGLLAAVLATIYYPRMVTLVSKIKS
ncbi:ECF transporter S component [Erysipelothrix tonsillarum]|uniref:ECF transporter S component n=1 Tax=Erysipelothrix tonsillarum TaxID=38402 RepID=UPI0003804EA6|nr:ECF transporter S component [Erysipelothrix tonsillarum]